MRKIHFLVSTISKKIRAESYIWNYLFTSVKYVTKPVTQEICAFGGKSKQLKDNVFYQGNDMKLLL